MKSIIILIDYFGKWPFWFPVFLESCRTNPTINWCIHTDCPYPFEIPPNVRIINITFESYCTMVSEKLCVRFAPHSAYSVCNLRPMFGLLHADIVKPYSYFGWCDIDVLFGDIRAFYDNQVLTHNVISTHERTCSGHFTLLRNTPWLIDAYDHINGWQMRLEDPGSCTWLQSLDESHLSALFSPAEDTRRRLSHETGTIAPNSTYFERNYFVEQWSTPFTPMPWPGYTRHPDVWAWENGTLYRGGTPPLQSLYLHLMNFKAARWIDEDLYGKETTWDTIGNCLHFSMNEFRDRPPEERKIRIDRAGLWLC